MIQVERRKTAILLAFTLLMTTVFVFEMKEPVLAFTQKLGYVMGAEQVNVRSGAGTSNAKVCQLAAGTQVTVVGEATASNQAVWYQIEFTLDGVQMNGYIHSDYVRTILPDVGAGEDPDYEAYLEQQQFPESYRVYLRALHKNHPTWTFVAMPTGLEWNNVVTAESKLGVNLISSSSKTSWKSLEAGAIDWTSGAWTGLDTVSWVAASSSVIKYYLDPRNFLRENYRILQFASLNYIEGEQTKEGLANILQGSFMASDEYYQIFMEAGRETGVNPYHLAARCLQEVGYTGSNSTYEMKDDAYAEFNGYYNYFNIGASPSADHNSMYNGLARAKSEGWDSPDKAIRGGAVFVGQKYVLVGQNSLYLEKFDVIDGGNGYYSHQYMTNLQAAASESSLMKKAYSDLDEEAVTYTVPVYLNMPQKAAAEPVYDDSPYCVLSALSVDGLQMSDEFDSYQTSYTITGVTDADSVVIQAQAYAPGAVITGAGRVTLQDGSNEITITCMGSDGSTMNYTVTIEKTPAAPVTGDVNGDLQINVLDAKAILELMVEQTTMTQEQLERADVNQDGKVDATDALLILQYTADIIEQF